MAPLASPVDHAPALRLAQSLHAVRSPPWLFWDRNGRISPSGRTSASLAVRPAALRRSRLTEIGASPERFPNLDNVSGRKRQVLFANGVRQNAEPTRALQGGRGHGGRQAGPEARRQARRRPGASCQGRAETSYRRREVGGGRNTRQPGQVRKEAALTRPLRVSVQSPTLLHRRDSAANIAPHRQGRATRRRPRAVN